MTDEALARRALAADSSALELLVSRYQAKVYSLARRLTGNRADAEEAAQECFLRAIRRLGTFRGEAKFGTWLYRIATHAALEQRRRKARRRSESLEPYLPRFDRAGRHARDIEDVAQPGADVMVDQARLARRAGGALERLDVRYRVPFVLRDLEELPTPEVAAILGITEALVRQRVHRARLMLRGFLSAAASGRRGTRP
jgi:RNA polymerase sigma-70 factor (ECF subfamily)